MMVGRRPATLGVIALLACGCAGDDGDPVVGPRRDSATPLAITGVDGSLQNPCWLPGGKLAFTNFRTRYNVGPSAVALVAAAGGTATALTPGISDEVNMPGGCVDRVHARIVYTSDQSATGHDEVFVIAISGGPPTQVTDRRLDRAFEPTFSPDGEWIVFESHPLTSETNGVLYKIRSSGTELTQLTTLATAGNARQPVWSPVGDKIVFQSPGASGAFDVFTIGPDGTGLSNVTRSTAEDTDASFSPDGRFIVYSSNEGGVAYANLHAIPAGGGAAIAVTDSDAYDGAPAWSPDGTTIAFETYPADPDDSAGTTLSVIAAPAL